MKIRIGERIRLLAAPFTAGLKGVFSCSPTQVVANATHWTDRPTPPAKYPEGRKWGNACFELNVVRNTVCLRDELPRLGSDGVTAVPRTPLKILRCPFAKAELVQQIAG